jgi:glycosyltransferase involved in cell wall biosynthesis
MKEIYFCVTNNISYDQRMKRICSSLSQAGYSVRIVGRATAGSPPLQPATYRQVRLNCFFQKGKMMYLEFNFRLFMYLLVRKPDCIVAIDLDTIIPCYYISVIKKIPRVYDAHEWFSELKEVVTRPRIKKAWLAVEEKYLPRFKHGYTVSASIAAAFSEKYGVNYELIMNTPLPSTNKKAETSPYLLYQGAVNEGRGFEWLIPAMTMVEMPLWICGEGNFSEACRRLIREFNLEHKVIMKGYVTPADLVNITASAYAGINLVEPVGKNQIFSLANKFFDYIHAGIPQLTMKFPEYERINDQYHIAVLIDKLDAEIIARELNNLLGNEVLYSTLKRNCARAAENLNWLNEEKKLISFYMKILS